MSEMLSRLLESDLQSVGLRLWDRISLEGKFFFLLHISLLPIDFFASNKHYKNDISVNTHSAYHKSQLYQNVEERNL